MNSHSVVTGAMAPSSCLATVRPYVNVMLLRRVLSHYITTHARSLCRPLNGSRAAHEITHRCLRHVPQSTTRQSAVREVASAADDFFAAEGLTFASLGLNPRVCESLSTAGFSKPAQVQELAVPAILSEQDVVLAAETGSGKTVAYLAPLVSFALDPAKSSAGAAVGAAALEPATSSSGSGAEAERPQGEVDARKGRTAALVLCPNVALCEQALSVAHSALSDPVTGRPLASAALVSSQSPPPLALPDVVFTTPAALLSLLDNAGSIFGSEWTRAGLESWARRVVLDEADLLLAGGYKRQMDAILDILKGGDRERAARRACAELGIPLDAYWEMPRLLRKAVQSGGAQGALEAGYRPPPPGQHQLQQEQQEQQQGDDSWDDLMGTLSGKVESVEHMPWRRQYVFVAATMPTEGGHTVGAELAAAFPSAAWLAGRQLHQSGRNVTHTWRKVEGPRQRAEALRELVAGDPLLSQGRGRVLIFAQDVASADDTAESLRGVAGGGGAEVPVLRYHRGVSAAQRAAALARVAAEEGVVLVCTDAAARGLDLPGVTHVVQADFAGNAVDFLHRVGRTARAGKTGEVTSLYSPEAEPLVGAIREAVAAGRPVEGAFSRKRSFRKKFKRYGQYVPRGREGAQRAAEPR